MNRKALSAREKQILANLHPDLEPETGPLNRLWINHPLLRCPLGSPITVEAVNQINLAYDNLSAGLEGMSLILEDHGEEGTDPKLESEPDPEREVVTLAIVMNAVPGPCGYAWSTSTSWQDEVREVSGQFHADSREQGELFALAMVLCESRQRWIEIHTTAHEVVALLESGTARRWSKNNWITKNGKPVANRNLWSEVLWETNAHRRKTHRIPIVSADEPSAATQRCRELAVAAANRSLITRHEL